MKHLTYSPRILISAFQQLFIRIILIKIDKKLIIILRDRNVQDGRSFHLDMGEGRVMLNYCKSNTISNYCNKVLSKTIVKSIAIAMQYKTVSDFYYTRQNTL